MDRSESTMAMGQVVRPKPRRVGPSNVNIPAVPLSNVADEIATKRQVDELLGLMLRKENSKADECAKAPFSSPYFFGSPPRRARNPITLDPKFEINEPNTIRSSPSESTSHSVVHVRLGQKQASMRVEGFDCKNSHVASTMG